ncbi:RHS repeat domain-containing protein [Paraburkholderia sp. J94]|uniref:RHS repeat domain-containing protein n=1 Tax=Paraburkholderia sp. J94 TaxID=2805441 RepID=UPI002AB3000E|nr:RHS repeat domain-containing protein [Paraburkholderia sp. J94]
MAERRYGFDAAGQLTQIADMRRGETRYAYDPLRRLTRAQGAYGEEKFGFDPASNIRIPTALDEHGIGVLGGKLSSPLLDNLLKEFAGTHYAYDDRGNLSQRSHNGERTTFGWEASTGWASRATVRSSRRTATTHWAGASRSSRRRT